MHALVIDDVMLSNNFANDSGGAFYSGTSLFDITRTSVSANNLAFVGGGRPVLWETVMSVQALGKSAFIGIIAEFGGATYTSIGVLVIDRDTIFSNNAVPPERWHSVQRSISTNYFR